MSEQSKKAYMEDSKGRLVPVSMVSDVDKLRDDVVLEIAKEAKALREAMVAFKQKTMGTVNTFVGISAEKYGVKMGGRKGNVSLLSFDGKYKVQVAIAEHLAFDERLQAAKKLIDECLTEWTGDGRDEIKTIVMDAFQVDKEGRINIGRILALRRLEIHETRWEKAMDAISDSMQVVGSKAYLRIYEQAGDGGYACIALDLAAL